MFVERHGDGSIKRLTNLSKVVGSICALIAAIAGGLFFMEDRYFNEADAQEMKSVMEADVVKTFQMQQKILKLEQKEQERTMDIRFLEQLRCQRVLVEKELKRDAKDTLLKDRLQRIKNTIKRLENKLFN